MGSKNKRSSFISKTITSAVGEDLNDKVFFDLFAGTGQQPIDKKIKGNILHLDPHITEGNMARIIIF